MKRTYYLITNTSGCTYWSFKADATNFRKLTTDMFQVAAILKHGPIFINRKGGWFPESCVSEIIKTVDQIEFPSTAEEDV